MIKYSLKNVLAATSLGLAVSITSYARDLPPVQEDGACDKVQQMPRTVHSSEPIPDIETVWQDIESLVEACYQQGSPDQQHAAEDWLTGPYLQVEDSPLLSGIMREDFKIAILGKAAWRAWPEDSRYRLLNTAADLLANVPASQLDLFSDKAEFIISMATEDAPRVERDNFVIYRSGAPDVIQKIIDLAADDAEYHYDFTIGIYRAALSRMHAALEPALYGERAGKLIRWAQSWKDTQPEKSLDALGHFALVGRNDTPSDLEDSVRTAFKDLVGVFEERHDYKSAFDALIQLGDFAYDGGAVIPDVEPFMVSRLPAILERHPVDDEFIESLKVLSNPDYGAFKFSDALMAQAAQKLQAIESRKLPTPQP